jgi:UDPglucose 6-dehydrogenase
MDKTSAIFPQVRYCREPYDVARDADALLILTEWPEFRQLDWERVYGLMARPLVIDGRNLLEPAAMAERGFEYHGFGRTLENHAPAAPPMSPHAFKAASVSTEVPLVS